MAVPNQTVCDNRFAIDFGRQSLRLFERGQWTTGIARVVESFGRKYEAFVSGDITAQQYSMECEPMVYTNPGGSVVDIEGLHFGVCSCLSKAASTLYSFDKVEDISLAQGSSLARAKDFVRINGIMKSPKFSEFTVIKKNYGPTSGLTPEKLMQVAAEFGAKNVPTTDGLTTILAGSRAMVGLFNSDKSTSSLFVQGSPLSTGRLYNFLGMNLRFGPEDAQNAIPSKDDTFLAIAVHRDALIETENMSLIYEVRTSLKGRIGWEFVSEFVSGLGVVKSEGVVLIEYDLKNTKN